MGANHRFWRLSLVSPCNSGHAVEMIQAQDAGTARLGGGEELMRYATHLARGGISPMIFTPWRCARARNARIEAVAEGLGRIRLHSQRLTVIFDTPTLRPNCC